MTLNSPLDRNNHYESKLGVPRVTELLAAAKWRGILFLTMTSLPGL
jgi:hypothetical protein